jgi:endonuclease/exonuclease/phosphatase family metal-dependent hydrolase
MLALGVLVWVLSASRPGSRLDECLVGCAGAGRLYEGPLRVLSLNMLHGFPDFERLEERLRIVGDEVRRLDADVVCLQEVPWRPGIGNGARQIAEFSGLNYVYVRANGSRWAILFEEGEAILSRYPLRDVAFAELAPRAGLFEHRVVLSAVAETPRGPVKVFVTHLTHGDPELNRAQVASLRAFVDESTGEGTVIVAGDFNAVEEAPQIASVPWIDAYRAARPRDPGYTCRVDDLTAEPGLRLTKRIDYVFLASGGEGMTVVDSRRALVEPVRVDQGWLRASDHAGLFVALE